MLLDDPGNAGYPVKLLEELVDLIRFHLPEAHED